MRITLFVAGNARSGTTALATLLNSHSQIVVTSERFLTLSSDDRMHELTQDHFNPEILANPVDSETNTFFSEETRNGIISKYATAKVVGDKSPTYDRHFSAIAQNFDNSRILYISRNIFNVATSYENFQQDPSLNWTSGYREAVADWNFSHQAMVKAVEQFPAICSTVSYERLFSFSPTYLKQLLEFLGVKVYDEAFAEKYKEMCSSWMKQFAKPTLTGVAADYVARNANFQLQMELIDKNEISLTDK